MNRVHTHNLDRRPHTALDEISVMTEQYRPAPVTRVSKHPSWRASLRTADLAALPTSIPAALDRAYRMFNSSAYTPFLVLLGPVVFL